MTNKLSILFILFTICFCTVSGVKANSLSVPEITSFAPSTVEKNALLLKFKSSNTGTNYSYELINTVNNKQNNLSGAITSFTLQNLNPNTEYGIMMRTCPKDTYSCTNWTSIKKAIVKSEKNETPVTPTKPTTIDKITSSFESYTFNNKGKSINISAKSSKGKALTYKSSNSKVATVSSKGLITSKSGGSAVITIKSTGGAKKTIAITVPTFRSREAALDKWRHILIDTFFQIYDRKYSTSGPCNYSYKNGTLKTGKSGNTLSCVTLPSVSLKRAGFMSSGCFYTTSDTGSTPNKNVKNLKKNSKYITIKYPGKSLSSLHKSGDVLYGDVLVRTNHSFIYMGNKSRGMKIYQSGGNRDIGNGTYVYYKHGKKSSKSKFSKTKQKGKDWKAGKIPDSAFTGSTPSSKNKKSKIHILGRINTYKIYTSCTNGTITGSNLYMAAQNYKINYAPKTGYMLKKITVDGKNVSIKNYKSSYTFKKLSKSHSISVIYTKK